MSTSGKPTFQNLAIRRTELRLFPDQSRVVLRPLRFGTDEEYTSIINRILALDETVVQAELDKVLADFSSRHRHFSDRLLVRAGQVEKFFSKEAGVSQARRALIGAYFLYEYSAEAAALFNPSIIPHPDQSGLPPGSLRFLISLRSTGEGHVSSITFRSGVIDVHNSISLDPPTRFLAEPELVENPSYKKPLFMRKLSEMKLLDEWSMQVMAGLGDTFTLSQLREVLNRVLAETTDGLRIDDHDTASGLWLLAKSNYEIEFSPDHELAERIIFPVIPIQSNGLEDVRLVVHRDDEGKQTIYATYTAYDGRNVLPQLFVTEDFRHFKFSTLNGPGVQNKGMALFPRMIDGRYAMLSRQDGENLYLMYSDNVHFWYEAKSVLKPEYPWEFIKLGNCGSPIETDAGWLVLSHGVGAMRRYCLGAFLLDKKDPSRVIGRLKTPLMAPEGIEREGYVPNVLYTCGALLRGDQLILPYGLSDRVTGFALISWPALLAQLQST